MIGTDDMATELTDLKIIATDTAQLVQIVPLTEPEKTEIDHEISHYPMAQAATIEALKIVQQHQGWVSDGKLIAIAEHLNIHPSEVESVATFYNRIYRQPVAENVFLICDSVSCWLMGQPDLMELAKNKLNILPGGSTEKITLLPTPCLGACDQAPVMMVNDQLIKKLTRIKLKQLINDLNEGSDSMGEKSGERL